jgi:hypothetical protein
VKRWHAGSQQFNISGDGWDWTWGLLNQATATNTIRSEGEMEPTAETSKNNRPISHSEQCPKHWHMINHCHKQWIIIRRPYCDSAGNVTLYLSTTSWRHREDEITSHTFSTSALWCEPAYFQMARTTDFFPLRNDQTPLGPTQPPIQWVLGTDTPTAKWWARVHDHSPPSSYEVTNGAVKPPHPHTSSRVVLN